MNTLALLMLFAAAPVDAPRPTPIEWIAEVDLIVVNRHRDVRDVAEINRVGGVIARREFSETWWVSFWEWRVVWIVRTPFPLFVSRGWWAMHDVRTIAPCTEGFAIERQRLTAGRRLTVVASQLRFIDSPFDWELRHRRLSDPFSLPR